MDYLDFLFSVSAHILSQRAGADKIAFFDMQYWCFYSSQIFMIFFLLLMGLWTTFPGSHNFSLSTKLRKRYRLFMINHSILNSGGNVRLLAQFSISHQFSTFSHQNLFNENKVLALLYRFRSKIMTFSPQLVKFQHQKFAAKITMTIVLPSFARDSLLTDCGDADFVSYDN